MKKALVCLTAVMTSVLAASQLSAKGIFIPPGPKANAMGCAFVAVADDASAIFFNPAGLAQQDKTGVSLSAFYVSADATSNKSLGNSITPNIADGDFPLPGIYSHPLVGFEPTEFDSKAFKTSAMVPFIGAYRNMGSFVLGAGFYGSGGGGGKWEGSAKDVMTGLDTITASVEGQYAFLVTNISAAKQFTPELAAGLGLDWINMTDKKDLDRAYTKGAGSPLPLTNYALSMNQNASGSGIQVNAGLMYKAMENLKTGLIFRSGTTIKLKGTAEYSQAGLSAFNPFLGDGTKRSDYEQEYTYPMSYGIGAAYDIIPALTLSLEIDRYGYSASREKVTYATPNDVMGNVDESHHYNDTTEFHLGANYKYNDQWSFQAGVQNDPLYFDTKDLTLLNTDQYQMVYANLGASYVMGPILFQGNYSRGFNDTPTKGDRSFEYPLNLIRLSASYMF